MINSNNEMDKIVEDIRKWNDDRFERDITPSLAKRLLDEEAQELIEADKGRDAVEVLDALCDLVYVTIGTMHRSGMDQKDIQRIARNYNGYVSNEHWENNGTYSIDSYFFKPQAVEDNVLNPKELEARLSKYLFILDSIVSKEGLIKAIQAVVDSNNTKQIPSAKLDTDTKLSDKGDEYISPTKQLESVVNTYWYCDEN